MIEDYLNYEPFSYARISPASRMQYEDRYELLEIFNPLNYIMEFDLTTGDDEEREIPIFLYKECASDRFKNTSTEWPEKLVYRVKSTPVSGYFRSKSPQGTLELLFKGYRQSSNTIRVSMYDKEDEKTVIWGSRGLVMHDDTPLMIATAIKRKSDANYPCITGYNVYFNKDVFGKCLSNPVLKIISSKIFPYYVINNVNIGTENTSHECNVIIGMEKCPVNIRKVMPSYYGSSDDMKEFLIENLDYVNSGFAV